jgi:hypothetical protein
LLKRQISITGYAQLTQAKQNYSKNEKKVNQHCPAGQNSNEILKKKSNWPRKKCDGAVQGTV